MPIPYTGEALKTYERIHVLRSYHYNKLYISPEKIIYHINRHGFLHAYTAGKCKDYDGSKIYYIRDNLLTRENLLKESLTTFYRTKEEAKAAWEAMQADAEANTAEERPQEAANDQKPQEATQRPKRGTHSPATDEAHKTATAPAGDQGTTAGDKDNTRSDKAPQRGTQPPQETATAPQPATVSEAQEPANDQEPKTAADCHREPATRSGQTPQGAAPCHHPHSPATSPTEARKDRRRTNYHHRRKNATQSHAGSPQEIRSAADCHRRNLPQGAQQAPQRTERAQAEQVHVDSIKTPYRAKWKAESDHRSDNENGRSP